MRILCINPIFVPAADSEAFCSAKVVLGLLKREIDVVVLASEYYMHRTEVYDDSSMWDYVRDHMICISSTKKNRIHSVLSGLRYHTVWWINSNADWVDNVIKTARELHKKIPFDIVYSRSLPMIAHVAGYWVAMDLNIPWIANINDPWDWFLFPGQKRDEYSVAYRYSSVYWLRKTLKTATLVTYPSERLWKYNELISGVVHNAEIIPHIGYCMTGEQDQKIFTMLHAGILWNSGESSRSAKALLHAIKRLVEQVPEVRDKIRMVFVGPKDPDTQKLATDLGLGEIVIFSGRVSYEKSLRLIASANICILVEGKGTKGIFLPSKFADYVISNKPVIALSPREGTISDYAIYGDVEIVDSDDMNSIFEAIYRHYISWKANKNIEYFRKSSGLVDQFTENTIMRKFAAILDRVMNYK